MKPGEGRTILFVDDEVDLTRLMHRTYIDRGFKVEIANDGLEGLMKVEKVRPDLIVTDIMMPKLDGLSLAKAVKSKPETRGIPIIFLTSKGDPRTLIDGINSGARYYLTKPFTMQELLVKVNKALGIPE